MSDIFLSDKITQKTKHCYSIIFLWKIPTNKKILGVIIDDKLNFKSHISELSKKASQKIAALSRLSSYPVNSDKKINFQLDDKITI